MDTLPSVPGLPLSGVAMNEPPASILNAAMTEIRTEMATLPDGARGALVGIATTRGVNLALATRVNGHVEVTAWIGKTWGDPISGGAKTQVHW